MRGKCFNLPKHFGWLVAWLYGLAHLQTTWQSQGSNPVRGEPSTAQPPELVGCSVWLVWLVGLSVGQSIGRSVGWLVNWSVWVGWLVVRYGLVVWYGLVGWLFGMGWLVGFGIVNLFWSDAIHYWTL